MDPARPLEGIRVCDFFWLIAGPLTSRLLADLGAEVIKVESSARMDQIRLGGTWPPQTPPSSPNAVFADCNTGKRSFTVNLNDPRGIAIIKRLVQVSDIVTNNFTGERMDRWGLGYDDLVRVKPDIIMLTMPVMGRTGPYSNYGANGNGVIAFGGLDTNMGFPGRPPVGMGPLYSDFASPFFAVSALMAALYHRDRTGEGQFIDLAQAQATVALLGTGILEYSGSGVVPEPPGNRSRVHSPHGVYRSAGDDRWVAIAVTDAQEWRALCDVIGRRDWGDDPAFASVDGRRAREGDVDEAIEAWTSPRDAWQAMHVLQSAGVAAAVVEDVEDMVVRDPHLSVDHFRRVSDPIGTEYVVHGVPIRFDGRQPHVERAPVMGEHNEYVLRDLLALPSDEIAALVADSVIS